MKATRLQKAIGLIFVAALLLAGAKGAMADYVLCSGSPVVWGTAQTATTSTCTYTWQNNGTRKNTAVGTFGVNGSQKLLSSLCRNEANQYSCGALSRATGYGTGGIACQISTYGSTNNANCPSYAIIGQVQLVNTL